MSKYKIGDIVLCRRYNNFIGNLFTGEIVKVTKLKRNVGKGMHTEHRRRMWYIFDAITFYKWQPEKLYRYSIKYNDDTLEQNIPAKLIFEKL